MRYAVWVLVFLLLCLRQDHWNWSNTRLVWGFLPGSLFSQACISLSAVCVWWLAVTFAWPVDPDAEFVSDAGVDPSVKVPDPATHTPTATTESTPATDAGHGGTN